MHSRTHAKLALLHAARQLTFSGPTVAVAVGCAVAVEVGCAVAVDVAVAVGCAVAVEGAVGIAGACVAPGSVAPPGPEVVDVVDVVLVVALALPAASAALAGVHFPDHASQLPTATITIAPDGSREIVPSQSLCVVNRHDDSSEHLILSNSTDPGAAPILIDPPMTGVPPTETDCEIPIPGPVTAIPVAVTFRSSLYERSPPGSASCRA